MSFLAGLASAFLPNIVHAAQRTVGSIAGGLGDIISGQNVGQSLARAGKGILSGINESVQAVTPEQAAQGLNAGLASKYNPQGYASQYGQYPSSQTLTNIIGGGQPQMNQTLPNIVQSPYMGSSAYPQIIGSQYAMPGSDFARSHDMLASEGAGGIRQGGQPVQQQLEHAQQVAENQRGYQIPQPYTTRGGGQRLNAATLQSATPLEKQVARDLTRYEAGPAPRTGVTKHIERVEERGGQGAPKLSKGQKKRQKKQQKKNVRQNF